MSLGFATSPQLCCQSELGPGAGDPPGGAAHSARCLLSWQLGGCIFHCLGRPPGADAGACAWLCSRLGRWLGCGLGGGLGGGAPAPLAAGFFSRRVVDLVCWVVCTRCQVPDLQQSDPSGSQHMDRCTLRLASWLLTGATTVGLERRKNWKERRGDRCFLRTWTSTQHKEPYCWLQTAVITAPATVTTTLAQISVYNTNRCLTGTGTDPLETAHAFSNP